LGNMSTPPFPPSRKANEVRNGQDVCTQCEVRKVPLAGAIRVGGFARCLSWKFTANDK
jgi:hypothetical protein